MAQKVKLLRAGLVLALRVAPFGDDGPVLTGSYTPMTRQERDEYAAALDGKPPAARLDLLAAEIGRRVLSWDIPDADPKRPADVKDVPPVFLDRIETHLTGYAVSPQGYDDEKKSA